MPPSPDPFPLPELSFPPDLPVSARREDIMAAMAHHPVVIVSGETGSGKTTQLPKMALALGRAAPDPSGKGRGRLIGHTQPRRLAATSVAKRVAQELGTELGQLVGYKIRFQDRLSPSSRIKLMTDGILLAETQTDPLLKAYDTLIIDEAHERSLNIDFLLGYLKRILPRRPDLKVIITSATIDSERFARFFASAKGPAPVIEVSGRTHPVTLRYTPFEESRDFDLSQAIAEAVDELWRGLPSGDILVFLPGEREIREAADHLRAHLSHQAATRTTEVIALYARLSQSDQDRVFEAHSAPRIVLATNVAETSLTVPGIRYVIDSGLARVKRYSYRNKVEQLLVEPISQAAANQRSGRCGRIGPGIAIRLYDEKDFAGRARFTDPEILRSSLAGVILRMHALGLGRVSEFDFLEPPRAKAITDGEQLLVELGALTEDLVLTPLGQALSRLPLDPRVGRMLLAAREQNALQEALVIAAALSVPDVRDRPVDAQTQADQAHARFKDDKSEFSGYLQLWHWLDQARGGKKMGSDDISTHKLSHRQYEQLLRQHYIHVRRVREWRDVYAQLHTVVAEHRWNLNTQPASYEQLHTALLAGMLGNVGYKLDEPAPGTGPAGQYLGARGIKFFPHPGAQLRKKPGKWVVCAELVETTRLFGRGIAHIEPQWLEQVGAHLLKRQLLDPHWEKRSGDVVAMERATLYGLVVYSGRRTSFAKADPKAARELFIRDALVAGDVDADTLSRWAFLRHNLKLVQQVEQLEHKSRRQDVLVDDSLIHAFYDQQLPAEVCNVRTLDAWLKAEIKAQPQCLHLSREELMRHTAAGITTEAFPHTIKLGGVDCKTDYLHEPGHVRDGVTVTVPLFVLNQVSEDRLEWLVPGMLAQKIQALLKSLPQKPRARLVPLPDTAAQLAKDLSQPEVFGQGALLTTLLERVRQASELDVKRSDFKLDMVPVHLLTNVCVVDDNGRQLGMGRHLAALKAEWGGQARTAFQALAQLKKTGSDSHSKMGSGSPVQEQPAAPQKMSSDPIFSAPVRSGQRHTSWDFGELPELMEISKGGQTLVGFPALVDAQDAVTIEVFDEPDVAFARHRQGLRRLVALHIRDALKYLDKNLPDLQKMAVAYMGLGTEQELRQQILDLALDRAFLQDPLPKDAQTFEQRVAEGRGRLTLIANEVARACGLILSEWSTAQRKLKDTRNAPEACADVTQQLQRLMGKMFIRHTPWAQFQHLPRYLKAITLRLDKYRADPARDAQRLAELKPLEQKFWRLVADRKGVEDPRLTEFRWLLEELRVSLFAQELRTPQPVSVKRLEKAWAQLMH